MHVAGEEEVCLKMSPSTHPIPDNKHPLYLFCVEEKGGGGAALIILTRLIRDSFCRGRETESTATPT